MTLAMCDMKTKNQLAQSLFWRKLNAKCQEHGVKEVQFVGFIADFAHANWLVVQEVQNKGKEMTGCERSCQFHFEENLGKWIDDHVAPTSRKLVDLVHP
jgi:hypothetical protein